MESGSILEDRKWGEDGRALLLVEHPTAELCLDNGPKPLDRCATHVMSCHVIRWVFLFDRAASHLTSHHITSPDHGHGHGPKLTSFLRDAVVAHVAWAQLLHLLEHSDRDSSSCRPNLAWLPRLPRLPNFPAPSRFHLIPSHLMSCRVISWHRVIVLSIWVFPYSRC